MKKRNCNSKDNNNMNSSKILRNHRFTLSVAPNPLMISLYVILLLIPGRECLLTIFTHMHKTTWEVDTLYVVHQSSLLATLFAAKIALEKVDFFVDVGVLLQHCKMGIERT